MIKKKRIVILGGGASALSLASFLDGDKYDVTIYERNKALGRKFLVAGKGGFNLTHSESVEMMIAKYSPMSFLEGTLKKFTNVEFRAWLDSIDIPTYVGSSRRVFPTKGIKPIEVLNHIKANIASHGHKVIYNSTWIGWTNLGDLLFEDGLVVETDIVVFCLGGGSWKITGSDGSWIDVFEDKGINVSPFIAANCAYAVNWDDKLIRKSAGKPLKNIAIQCQETQSVGEAVITKFGIEGSSVYALTDRIQSELTQYGSAKVYIDLKPMLSYDKIREKLTQSKRKITDALLNDVKLEKVKVQLLKSIVNKADFTDLEQLSKCIKSLPITLMKAEEVDRSISTTGGIRISEVDEHYQFHKLPNHFAIGEMLDWNAPTGGYLLQACFSMGYCLASYLNAKD